MRERESLNDSSKHELFVKMYLLRAFSDKDKRAEKIPRRHILWSKNHFDRYPKIYLFKQARFLLEGLG